MLLLLGTGDRGPTCFFGGFGSVVTYLEAKFSIGKSRSSNRVLASLCLLQCGMSVEPDALKGHRKCMAAERGYKTTTRGRSVRGFHHLTNKQRHDGVFLKKEDAI